MMLPARIACCITTLDDGGAERQFVELVSRLPRDRFDPRVLVLSAPPTPPANRLLQKLSDATVPVVFLRARHVGHTVAACRRLTRELRQWKPAVVQCFLAHANVLGAWAAHRAGVPHVFTGIRVTERRARGHVMLQRWTDRFVTRHVCVSQSVADFSAREMRLPAEKLVVIPNGIDLQRFDDLQPISCHELGLEPGRRMILFAGRLDPQKRPDWLLERMPGLADCLPQHDLVLAGDGPLRPQLEQLARRLGVERHVHFLGWRPDVLRLLAAADVVVLTSAWEGMPNAILEAMAAARPIVATEVDGVVELLGSDAGGQITPSDDPQAFVEAVARIAGNGELAHELGQRNRLRVAERYSVQRMVDAYACLYASAVGP